MKEASVSPKKNLQEDTKQASNLQQQKLARRDERDIKLTKNTCKQNLPEEIKETSNLP